MLSQMILSLLSIQRRINIINYSVPVKALMEKMMAILYYNKFTEVTTYC